MAESDQSYNLESEEEYSSDDEGYTPSAEPYLFEPEYTDAEVSDLESKQRSECSVNVDHLGSTDWCSCRHCVPMEQQFEATCCNEIKSKRKEAMCEENPELCISKHPGFDAVCLNPWVLETAHLAYMQERANDTEQQLWSQHRRYRHIAYRQFVCWVWGHLGRSIRVPLPSCVVNAIREKFPDTENYAGFKYPDLQ